MLLGRVCVFLRMELSLVSIKRALLTLAAFPRHSPSSKDVLQGWICSEPLRPCVLRHHLKQKASATAPGTRLGRESHGGCPVLPLPPPCPVLSSPGFSWTGLWSGASERKALMKWGPREQPPHRGPALGNCFLASLLSEAAEGLRACCCLPGEELWGTGHSSAFFCACLWK